MTSLTEKVEVADGDPEMQRTMDYWRPVRAQTMYHETYHWKNTVSDPRCRDHTYQAEDVVDLAVKDQTKASNNAEYYTQAAMAIYLQQVFHLSSPPTPEGYGTSSNSSVSIAGTEILETYLDDPPRWWQAPVANTPKAFKPDMTDITMMSGVGFLTAIGPFASCVDGLYEDMEQCMVFCSRDNSSCDQSSSNSTIVCSGFVIELTTPVCKEGSYSGFDECDAHCSGGSCFENAGESGIHVQCEDCPYTRSYI
ncbi:hypothetical protein N7478_000087 [Penicillium angulare]|uniref:uncharacterized protein n=1 Tax=Penicillium angulare TaxID=116970 RepID=UPI0025401F38|nr:uncharacterized protein N7478_000087 [Penicillium angulare]KAJ5290836.1 hypothetical protein N7478_000087 [Penicillium angulare]